MKTKQDIIDEIRSLEDTIIHCQDVSKKLKAELHEIECDEENERLEQIKSVPIRKMNSFGDWNRYGKAFDDLGNYLDDIAKIHGIKTAIYSSPEHDLEDVAIVGDAIVEYDSWDSDANEFSVKVSNPTWLDLWKIADNAIRATGDLHHVFFEGIYKQKNGTYRLSMGS